LGVINDSRAASKAVVVAGDLGAARARASPPLVCNDESDDEIME